MQITNDLLDRLEKWKCEGERLVELRLDRNNETWTVWAYDFNLTAGTFLRELSDVENISALIISKKKKQLSGLVHEKSLESKNTFSIKAVSREQRYRLRGMDNFDSVSSFKMLAENLLICDRFAASICSLTCH